MKEKDRYRIINGKRRVICCERGVFGIKHECCKSNPQQDVERLIKALGLNKKKNRRGKK